MIVWQPFVSNERRFAFLPKIKYCFKQVLAKYPKKKQLKGGMLFSLQIKSQ
jgi:hypothetical protein